MQFYSVLKCVLMEHLIFITNLKFNNHLVSFNTRFCNMHSENKKLTALALITFYLLFFYYIFQRTPFNHQTG